MIRKHRVAGKLCEAGVVAVIRADDSGQAV
jgi:hypothetical protein